VPVVCPYSWLVLACLFHSAFYSTFDLKVNYFESANPVWSAEEAVRLRRKFGRMSASERKRSGVRLMNSVTPATRVRISILKSISVAYKAVYPSGTASLIGYISRPVLRCRPKATGPLRSYDFTSAVTGLDLKALGLTDSDFAKAYQIAGRKFYGEMDSSFIVLKNDSPLCNDERPDGRKRNAEESPAPNPSRRPHLSESMDVVEVEHS